MPAPWTIINLKGCEGEAPENPVPQHSAPRDEGFIPGPGLAAAAAGVAPSKALTMLSFDIRTGQAAAEAALAAAEAQEVQEEEEIGAEAAVGGAGAPAAAPPAAAAALPATTRSNDSSAPIAPTAPMAPVSLVAVPAVLVTDSAVQLRAAPVDAQLPVLLPLESNAGAVSAAPLRTDVSSVGATSEATVPPAGSHSAPVPDAIDPEMAHTGEPAPAPAVPTAQAAVSDLLPAPVAALPSAAVSSNTLGLTAEDLDAITFDG